MLNTIRYQERVLVYLGEEILPINVSEILFVFSEGNYRFLYTKENVYHVTYTLDALEKVLGCSFYRVNRQYLVSFNAIDKIFFQDSSAIQVHLKNSQKRKVIVSRRKSNNFRKWLESPYYSFHVHNE